MSEDRLSNIQLVFTRELWEELLFLTKELAPFEVSGLGEIEITSPGRIQVRRLHLVKQKATGADTRLEPQMVVELMDEIATRYDEEHKMPVGADKWHLRLWFHTHADGQVFWSSIDEKCCKELRRSAEWFVSIVVNVRGEALARIDGVGEFGPYAVAIGVVIESTLSKKRKNLLREEIEEKVTKIVPPEEIEQTMISTSLSGVHTCGECSKFTHSLPQGKIGFCTAIRGNVSADSLGCEAFVGRGLES